MMNESGGIYLTLKLAAQLFAKPLEALAADELRRVRIVATRQQEIEALILSTPEAAGVMLPEASIEASLKEIRDRYGSDEDYHADLDRIGLDAASLRQAVERDMRVEALLEKVGARAAAVSDTEVEIFWFMHKERFRRAETRVLRHILVTINEQLTGNERGTARASIEAIRARLLKNPERFAEQALKHSECPTAMNGGLLGQVPRGKLYPEIDAVAFALPVGGLSDMDVLKKLHRMESTFTRAQLMERLALENVGRLSVREIEREAQLFLQRAPLMQLRNNAKGQEQFVAQYMLDMERSIVERGNARRDDSAVRVRREIVEAAIAEFEREKNATLTDEQRKAVEWVCAGTGGTCCVTGFAGTGKTFSALAFKKAFEADGRRLIGVAIAWDAAKKLEAETGMEIEFPKETEKLDEFRPFNAKKMGERY